MARRDRWWAPPTESDVRQAEGDRTSYRVRCPDEQVFDLFHDAVSGLGCLTWHTTDRRHGAPGWRGSTW